MRLLLFINKLLNVMHSIHTKFIEEKMSNLTIKEQTNEPTAKKKKKNKNCCGRNCWKSLQTTWIKLFVNHAVLVAEKYNHQNLVDSSNNLMHVKHEIRLNFVSNLSKAFDKHYAPQCIQPFGIQLNSNGNVFYCSLHKKK